MNRLSPVPFVFVALGCVASAFAVSEDAADPPGPGSADPAMVAADPLDSTPMEDPATPESLEEAIEADTVAADATDSTYDAPWTERAWEGLKPGEMPDHLGWLSNPDEPAENIWQAAVGGKVLLNNRLRFETVGQDGLEPAWAITNRIRLGYQSKPWMGFSWLIEMENVASPDESLFFVPPIPQGDSARAVVADPSGTEVNQGYAQWVHDDYGLALRVGRQRVILDNARFIGNVGWRQFEQTFDAAAIQSNFGIDGLEALYAYVWYVQTIFGPNGPNLDTQSHLINTSYTVAPWLKATGFVYLLDVTDAAAASNNSYGLRFTGTVPIEENEEQDLAFIYEATYAFQTDAANNPTPYQAHYIGVDGQLDLQGTGYAGLGYELLSADNGVGFQTPLATLHKFNGWADVFLATPATGLQDLYVYVGTTLPWEIDGKIIFHKFWSQRGGSDFGLELDAVLSKQVIENVELLVGGAAYDGLDGPFADRIKFWMQLTLAF